MAFRSGVGDCKGICHGTGCLFGCWGKNVVAGTWDNSHGRAGFSGVSVWAGLGLYEALGL